MSQVSNKVLDLALACIKVIGEVGNEDLRDGFRTRCRQELERLYYNGLSYELAYILSKASDSKTSGYVKLNGLLNKGVDLKTYIMNLIQNKQVSDEAYELYGACLIWAIRELGMVDGVNDLLAFFNKLNTPGTEELYTSKLLTFAEWLKRLAEATIRG